MMCVRADNVGDNVGDIAGMGADLFGSFAEATCAALVISSVSALGSSHLYCAMQYPLLISACGIVVCLVTAFIATDLKPARMVSEIESTLKYQLIISTVIATPVRSPPSPPRARRAPPSRPRQLAIGTCAAYQAGSRCGARLRRCAPRGRPGPGARLARRAPAPAHRRHAG